MFTFEYLTFRLCYYRDAIRIIESNIYTSRYFPQTSIEEGRASTYCNPNLPPSFAREWRRRGWSTRNDISSFFGPTTSYGVAAFRLKISFRVRASRDKKSLWVVDRCHSSDRVAPAGGSRYRRRPVHIHIHTNVHSLIPRRASIPIPCDLFPHPLPSLSTSLKPPLYPRALSLSLFHGLFDSSTPAPPHYLPLGAV